MLANGNKTRLRNTVDYPKMEKLNWKRSQNRNGSELSYLIEGTSLA